MTMTLLLRVCLALHLCGLVIMTGTTVVDYITFKLFCNLLHAAGPRALGLLPIMARYGALVRTGAAILLISGVIMVRIDSFWWREAWFKVKLGLVILLVLNGAFPGNRLGSEFRQRAIADPAFLQQDAAMATSLNRFYLLQLVLFLLIILISVIRPGRQVIS